MAVVLDASFLADLRAKRRSAIELMDELNARGEAGVVPTVVLAEFLAGSVDSARDLAEARNAAQILEFGADDAAHAAAISRRTRKQGQYPGWGDVLLAGFAATRGLPIVTRNPRHFPESKTITY